ncbi:MAG: M48 family metalloprotease [Pirellulaceae bacterium]|nr:M48 family metalloprotease [Planctomycetales bacterium]
MAFDVPCPFCAQQYTIDDKMVGKRVRCKKCGEMFQLLIGGPSAAKRAEPVATGKMAVEKRSAAAGGKPARKKSAGGAATSTAALRAEFLQGFRGDIEPVRRQVTYIMWSLIVLGVLAFLFIAYLALIVAVGWIVVWHLQHDVGMLSAARGRGAAIVLIAYLAPAIVGLVMVVFMIKPLFARPASQGRTRSLNAESEPILFAFVERLCAAVNAPVPKRIEVDCQVNASARLGDGLMAMLIGRKPILTIGMPLVAGMSAPQLAGVLAHEFGHFSQGAGMRLSALIRYAAYWFARVVYERDQWDEALAGAAHGLDIRLAWVVYLAQFCVWISRKILWLFMLLANAVAGFLLREMEFDADRYEARLAGSETFASTAIRLRVLGYASHAAHEDLRAFYQEGRLGDDLPRLIEHHAAQQAKPLKEIAVTEIEKSETGWFDSHPCDSERIENAREEEADGEFQSKRPARDLFVHYAAICKGVTLDFYREVLDQHVDPKKLHPIDDLLGRIKQESDDVDGIKQYFGDTFSPLRALRLPTTHITVPDDPRATLARLQRARNDCKRGNAEYVAAIEKYDAWDTQLIHASIAIGLYRAQLPRKGMEFKVPVDTREAVGNAERRAQAELKRSSDLLAPYEEHLGYRLCSAFEILYVDQVARKIDNAKALQTEIAELLPLAQQLTRMLQDFHGFQRARTTLMVLCNHLDRYQNHEPLQSEVMSILKDLSKQMLDLVQQVNRCEYPFDHANQSMTVADFLLPVRPTMQQYQTVFAAADAFGDRFPRLYSRVVGRLASIALKVERALATKAD